MISEEEKRYVEATKCKDCLSWHHHCNAECCKLIFLDVDPKELEEGGKLLAVKPSEPLGPGMRRYYQLRDVECIRGLLRFKKERIKIIRGRMMYVHPCKLLKDNLCEDHPDNKPEICKKLNLKTAKLLGQGFFLTDNCLFKYKCKEVEKVVKKEETKAKKKESPHLIQMRLARTKKDYITNLINGRYFLARCNMIAVQIQSKNIKESIDGCLKSEEFMRAEYAHQKLQAISSMRGAHFSKQELLKDFKLKKKDIFAIEEDYYDGKVIREDYDESYKKDNQPKFVDTSKD